MILDIVSDPLFLICWALAMVPSLIVLIYDLRSKNAHLMPLMKLVWALTVLYSGPLGLLIYWKTGRKEIARDSIWRRSFRSVAHCYSGCGMGEIVGVVIAVGLLSLGNLWVAGITFVLAYVAGYSLTVGPLMQEGVPFRTALRDAFFAETPSIAVMEVVAIGSDLYLAGSATMGEIIFWSSLIVSLTLGLLAAYPVNVLLIHFGVKEGMMDPRMSGHAHA
ncbi:DUF4396 domain-containing protein [Stappia sp. GBMRC 2046]|uniref:DUF4396 domain-containing protein n=1 Tax=Stappia sediminis TaxID=2692190 RepID=A0A7X3LSU3_9HYPH|nr:DUF4396 domain-containing protein [Stappia sediminis]MXN64474.1 DUF4396 domain-containing protein [Stappia sediminis]